MLSPKKTKYRKMMKGRIKGNARSCNKLAFGDYGLIAIETGKITGQQIEAARVAMSRATGKGGRLWIRIFPDKPITKKPLEVRMGKGKGAVDHYVAVIKPGRIIYELGAIDKETAIEALMAARSKLPIKTKLLVKDLDPWILPRSGPKLLPKLVVPKPEKEKPAVANPEAAAKPETKQAKPETKK